MVPNLRPLVLLAATGLLASCTRAPSETFSGNGFRDSRVVIVSDTSEIETKDVSPRFRGVPFVRPGETPAPALRAATGRELTAWGSGCGSRFQPKAGSFDVRMGLVRQADGWNVGNAIVMRNYVRATQTDYLVVVNKVLVSRNEIDRAGAGQQGKLAQVEATLDISVIDAAAGKRVWRSQTQARAERADSLEILARDAIRQAADNFFTSLPEARRWGCPEVLDRFH